MSLMSSSTVTAGRSILTGKELHCTNSLCQKFPPQYRGDFVGFSSWGAASLAEGPCRSRCSVAEEKAATE